MRTRNLVLSSGFAWILACAPLLFLGGCGGEQSGTVDSAAAEQIDDALAAEYAELESQKSQPAP